MTCILAPVKACFGMKSIDYKTEKPEDASSRLIKMAREEIGKQADGNLISNSITIITKEISRLNWRNRALNWALLAVAVVSIALPLLVASALLKTAFIIAGIIFFSGLVYKAVNRLENNRLNEAKNFLEPFKNDINPTGATKELALLLEFRVKTSLATNLVSKMMARIIVSETHPNKTELTKSTIAYANALNALNCCVL